MTLKTLLSSAFIGASLALSACSNADAPRAAQVESVQIAELTPVSAVLIYADWCGSCKVLDPKLKAVLPQFEDRGVTLVTLDYTAKDKDAFYAAANAAGVGEAVRSALGDTVKTGQLFLVPEGASAHAQKVNMSHTEDEIAERIMLAMKAG